MPTNTTLPEIRRDFLTGRYVIIRPPRKYDIEKTLEEKIMEKKSLRMAELCPLCPGKEEYTPKPELYSKTLIGEEYIKRNNILSDWVVRVIPNKFPLLMIEGESNSATDILFTSMSGIGAHEIIVDHRSHCAKLHQYSKENIKNIIKAASLRHADLKNDKKLKYFLLFKNYGEETGASLCHPHSQIIAFPFIPPKAQLKIQAFRDYSDRFNKCVLCDYLEREMSDYGGIRFIEKNEHFISLAPYASEWAYKIMIAPICHHPSWAGQMKDADILESFSSILASSAQKISRVKNNAPYNLIFFNNPYDSSDNANGKLHWHLEIMPQIHRQKGTEQAAEIYANPISPEEAAEVLRNIRLNN